MNKKLVASLGASLVLLCVPAVAFAHVVVTPAQADVGQELVFNVSVPNERQAAVSSVRVLIPRGVTDVTPTMQPGWTVNTTTGDSAQDSEVTSITWTGEIPIGQRDDFSFGAQVPGTAGDLDWKAYQTYADGTVVHWDQKPSGSDDAVGTAGPYSVTHVINDLTSASDANGNGSSTKTTLGLVLGASAFVLSIASLFVRRR